MDRDATLYCPNSSCQAPNAERSKFCQRCRTLLPKRYLWAIEPGRSSDELPEMLDDRYILKHDRVYLDTYPGILPHVPEQVPPEIRAYLRLFPYRWHVPQIYGSASPTVDSTEADTPVIWLLENAPIEPRSNGTWRQYPHIDLAWSQVDDLHKLGWLWQILNLWTDCVREGVASTLLDSQQVRVDGSFIRIAQLIPDTGSHPPGLDKLGYLWSRWVPTTKPPLRDFFDQLCRYMIEGQLHTPEQVQTVIDRAIDRLKTTRDYRWQVTTLSDRGPSRSRNEDACFPLTEKPDPPRSQVLSIVCDGVGGHDGGDIASGLAISTVSAHVHLPDGPAPSVSTQSRADKLERVRDAIAIANDVIGQRNNDEQRQGRQRMGTTIVIGQGEDNDLFISHVGDSRAYLVNARAFYSLTVDDDVASREVRLGYAFYRTAVHQPAAGSLVQALGMGASNHLYPTTQRFIVNEDCIVLLCSDGLSDYDRVEQHWKTELQPILNQTTSLTSAAHRLVEIANTQNGHDNVTVGLMQLQVLPRPNQTIESADLTACLVPLPNAAAAPIDSSHATVAANTNTAIHPRRRSFVLPVLAISVPLAILTGVFLPSLIERFVGRTNLTQESDRNLPVDRPSNDAAEIQLEDRTRIDSAQTTSATLKVGQQLMLRRPLVAYPDKIETSPPLDGAIPSGAIVQVKAIDKTLDRHWLQVRSCPQDLALEPNRTASTASSNGEDSTQLEASDPIPSTAIVPTEQPEGIDIWVEFESLNRAGYDLYTPPPGQVWSCDSP
ncbi:MAG: serine/threonine protein phosphatase [Oscillatoriales cyanobacterium]|nr:MAG: serine/threonine protein phosphatase [Oscillatoriales cyanobacterium]